MSNPFTLETDNKKFFTGLASSALDTIYENPTAEDNSRRIKNMNEQLEQLAKKREQLLFKQSQMDYIFKKQKPITNLNDFVTGVGQGGKDRKFRVRALLKQKKQSMHDFLNKKKEIYLSKMNINIKKQEKSKLQDYIKDEQQTLKARKLYFDNDVEFMHRFIDGIKKQAQQAQASVQAQLKQQENLVSKLNGLQAEIQKVDNQISKDQQILENLQLYKKFIDGLYDPDRNWKHYTPKKMSQEVLFMTENLAGLPSEENDGMNLVIKYQPQNMIEIFNDSEESNIRQIQNLQDKQAELQIITKQEGETNQVLEQLIRQNEERISELQKKCETKLQNCQRLKQLRKVNNSKINILDYENLDIQKVGNRIFQIYKEVNQKRAVQVEKSANETQMKREMTEIEQQIEKLRNLIKIEQQAHPHLLNQIEKQIKNNIKRQNQIRKQEENKQIELKKQLEQEKKRNQTQNQKVKGRRDMQKVLIQKKVKKKKETNLKDIDDSDKYLKEDQAI